MHNFKAGDKVILKYPDKDNRVGDLSHALALKYLTVGAEYTVIAIPSDYTARINTNLGNGWTVTAACLVLKRPSRNLPAWF